MAAFFFFAFNLNEGALATLSALKRGLALLFKFPSEKEKRCPESRTPGRMVGGDMPDMMVTGEGGSSIAEEYSTDSKHSNTIRSFFDFIGRSLTGRSNKSNKDPEKAGEASSEFGEDSGTATAVSKDVETKL